MAALFSVCPLLCGGNCFISFAVSVPGQCDQPAGFAVSALYPGGEAGAIRETSDFLLKNMAFFFLPAGVQVMEQFAVIQSQIPILLFIIAVTLVLTFLASSLIVTAVIRWMEKRERKGQKDGSL